MKTALCAVPAVLFAMTVVDCGGGQDQPGVGQSEEGLDPALSALRAPVQDLTKTPVIRYFPPSAELLVPSEVIAGNTIRFGGKGWAPNTALDVQFTTRLDLFVGPAVQTDQNGRFVMTWSTPPHPDRISIRVGAHDPANPLYRTAQFITY